MCASLRIWCVAREEKDIAFTIDWPSMQDISCTYFTLAAMIVGQVVRALTERLITKLFAVWHRFLLFAWQIRVW